MVDVGEVEQRVEQVKASGIPMEATIGGVVLRTVPDLAKLSDIISRSRVLPPHARNDGATCCVLALKAMEWGFPIISVIESSTVINDRLGYTSQMIHAVVEKNAPIKHRLRYEIVGDGEERRCKVWATFKGEDEPHVYLSQPLAKMLEARPKRKDGPGFGGSPLWETNPEVQMFYSASRQWARIYCPDVILGAYTRDELEENPALAPPSQVAALVQRLKDAKIPQQGFDASQTHIIIEGNADEAKDATESADGDEATPDKPARTKKPPEPERRRRPPSVAAKRR